MEVIGIAIAGLFLVLFMTGVFSLVIQVKKIKKEGIKNIVPTVAALIGTIVIAIYLFRLVRNFIV